MYALSSSPESQGCIFWTIYLFLVELMVEHVSRRIKFVLMMLVVGSSFVVLVVFSPTCSEYDTVRVLSVYDGQFTA